MLKIKDIQEGFNIENNLIALVCLIMLDEKELKGKYLNYAEDRTDKKVIETINLLEAFYKQRGEYSQARYIKEKAKRAYKIYLPDKNMSGYIWDLNVIPFI